jgi:excisionase family DNA binding protein
VDDHTLIATLTLGAAAVYLGVSTATLRRWTREGVIPASRYAGALHYKLVDLDNFIRANTEVV